MSTDPALVLALTAALANAEPLKARDRLQLQSLTQAYVAKLQREGERWVETKAERRASRHVALRGGL